MFSTYLSCSIVAVLLLIGIIEVALRLLQLAIAFVHGGELPDPTATAGNEPTAFVSVHVPTCNEPPALVIATLEHLARSRFDRFEVIVIDNNTRDAALWAPVAAAAARLGFRFLHVDRLAGAKAGALNVALAATDPRATHVAIVDADYQVDPDFIGGAVAAVAGVDYVQFPQAYRAVGLAARGMEYELGDYFTGFTKGAGQWGAMLPTGTLSLFRAEALRAVGGWPTATITEDAEIGVRLQAAGFRGRWLSRNAGRGLLPVDLRGIRKQRARWSAGNVQVLTRLPAALGASVNWRDIICLVAQLTAWTTLVLPAAVALALVPLVPSLPMARTITALAAATILLSMLLAAGRILFVGDRTATGRVRLAALATRTALIWTSATAWAAALSPRPLRFNRTAKAIDYAAAGHDVVILGLSLAFLLCAAAHVSAHDVAAALACLVLAAAWPCGQFVDRALRHAAAHNPEMI